MGFKDDLQDLIYRYLPPTSTFKDYVEIGGLLEDEFHRLNAEGELFVIGTEDDDPPTTQAEAGIVPRTEHDWDDIVRRRDAASPSMSR